MYLMLYERYHWTTEDIDNLPVKHYTYIPVVAAAQAEIQKEGQRRGGLQ